MDDLDRRVRERAYELWEREGCPDGRQEEHWCQARDEIMAETGKRLPDSAFPEEGMVPQGTESESGSGAESTGRARRSRQGEGGRRDAAGAAGGGGEAERPGEEAPTGRGRRRVPE